MILRLRKKKETDMLNTRHQPPPQALLFSLGRGEHETRESGDEPQGTMGRVQTADARCLLPAFFCAHSFIERETSGYEADETLYVVQCGRLTGLWTRLVMIHKEQKARRHRLNAVISH